MSEWTKGPWRVFTTPDGRRVIGVGDRDGGGITDQGDVSTNDQGVWRSGREKLANARLIAAAPTMAEALEDLLAHTKGLVLPVTAHTMWQRADAALKLAKGADRG